MRPHRYTQRHQPVTPIGGRPEEAGGVSLLLDVIAAWGMLLPRGGCYCRVGDVLAAWGMLLRRGGCYCRMGDVIAAWRTCLRPEWE